MIRLDVESFSLLSDVDKADIRVWLQANDLEPNTVEWFVYSDAGIVAHVYDMDENGKVQWDAEAYDVVMHTETRELPLRGYMPRCFTS